MFVPMSPIFSYSEVSASPTHKAVTTQLFFGTKRTSEMTSEVSQITV